MVFVYHALIVSIHCQKQRPLPIVKRIWFDIHVHYLVLAVYIYLSELDPLLFFADYMLIAGYACVKVIDCHIAPRTGEEISLQIQEFTRPILKSAFIQRVKAVIEILLLPYLGFKALAVFEPRIWLAFLIDFFLFLPIAYKTRAEHQAVWSFCFDLSMKLTQGSQSAFGLFLQSAIGQIAKLDQFFDQVYGVPKSEESRPQM